ncbi:MAG: histidine phosphatase family protein [Bacillota bacterium]
METTVLLARHGETDWNRQLRCQGHTDVPLNEAGRHQARDLAERLRPLPLAAVYSSDLQRALVTARTAAEPHRLPVLPLVDLRERAMGLWEGLTMEDRRRRWPRQSLLWEQGDRHVDGLDMEPFEDLTSRLVRAVGNAAAQHPGRTILMVTHGAACSPCWTTWGRPGRSAAHSSKTVP